MNKIDNKKYTNCLRTGIVPNGFETEQVEEIKNYCLKYDVNNVILFINAECLNQGQMTIEEAKPWVEAIKKAKKVFNESGISVSLNYWNTFGHTNRGRKLKKGQNFRLMTGLNGNQLTWIVCPTDREWLEYINGLFQYFVKEIQPCIFWIEDDFRYHNHDSKEIGEFGCFCDEHMKMFNHKLGTNYTRAELQEQLFKSHPNNIRLMWLESMRDNMNTLSYEIGESIFSLGLNTEIGLMSSGYAPHSVEGRDWKTLGKNFTYNREIHRLHLPVYRERTGKDYYYDFNSSTMAIRSLLHEDVDIYPEMENSSFSSYVKNDKYLKFECESALPLVIKGMTYNLQDVLGNGIVEELNYGEVIKELNPYMQAVMDLQLKFSSLDGVVIPLHELAARYVTDVKSFETMYPCCGKGAGYLSAMGISYKFSTEKEFKGKVIYFFAENINFFTEKELQSIFANNYVLLEGDAVVELKKKGLGYLIGMVDCRCVSENDYVVAYEQTQGDFSMHGKKNYRASVQLKAAKEVALVEYNIPLQIFTKCYNTDRVPVANGMVFTNNFAVMPLCIKDEIFPDSFNPLRRAFLEQILYKNLKSGVIYKNLGVAPFLYHREKDDVIIFTNSTVETFKNVSFIWKGKEISCIQEVGRDGKIYDIEFVKDGEQIIIEESFEYLSTKVFIVS